jgi:hypothetical protein
VPQTTNTDEYDITRGEAAGAKTTGTAAPTPARSRRRRRLATESLVLAVRGETAAAMLEISQTTLSRLRDQLRPVRVGPRGALRYRITDIQKYIDSLRPVGGDEPRGTAA